TAVAAGSSARESDDWKWRVPDQVPATVAVRGLPATVAGAAERASVPPPTPPPPFPQPRTSSEQASRGVVRIKRASPECGRMVHAQAGRRGETRTPGRFARQKCDWVRDLTRRPALCKHPRSAEKKPVLSQAVVHPVPGRASVRLDEVIRRGPHLPAR